MEDCVNKEWKILTSPWKEWVEGKIGINLMNGLNEGAKLRKLLKWYFHMADNLGNLDLLVKNLSNYEKSLEELKEFSESSFMEETICTYRVPYKCWERLRGLLISFCNNIGIIGEFSKWAIDERRLRECLYFAEKQEMLKLCDFLEKKPLN